MTGHALHTHERSVADAIGNGWILQGHGVFAVQSAGAPIITANAQSPYHAKCGRYSQKA
ncbi:Unknown protein sequence [Pseudomonas coronafaciens pv. oryzae]|nr:Unknown protein sequence [Pseudomonas coronafaciens pv. oryzae]